VSQPRASRLASSPGKATRRHGGRLSSIGIGRTRARTRVIVLVRDLNVRVVDTDTVSAPPGPTPLETKDGRTRN
jgi:hypothetical protein